MRTAILKTLIFLCLPWSVAAQVQCADVYETGPMEMTLPVVRFGYLPMESRVPGGGSKGPLWTLSQIGMLKDGSWGIERSISTPEAVRHLNFPLPREMVREAAEKETTQNMAQPILEFVYQRFTQELVRREVFSREFIESLKAEDRARLEENVTIWAAVKNGEVVASWGLYRHVEGEFAGKFEIIRTATIGNNEYSLYRMLPLVTEYLNSVRVTEGDLMVRTDRVGSRLFKRLGAEQVQTYEGGTKVILEMRIEQFKETFPAPDIQHGNQPLQYVMFLDEPFIF